MPLKVLLAGPGTGKTTKIFSIIQEKSSAKNILILSFTNATVEALKKDLASAGVDENNCMTLHKFAVKYNHDKRRHVLNRLEIGKLEYLSTGVGIGFDEMCEFLSCTTFDQMIERFVAYAKSNPAYLKQKLSCFTTLIVDEYQDFNPSEQALIDLLIGHIEDSYIFGDDDQCIYDFKDASTDKIIALHNTYPALAHGHICHRCPDKVVEHATILIKRNIKRVDKKWDKSGKPGDLIYKQFATSDQVAEYIVQEIKKITTKTADAKILMLSPVEFAAKELAEKLESQGIEYTNYFIDPVPEQLIINGWKIRTLFGAYRYLNLLLLGYILSPTRKKLYALLKRQVEQGQDFQELYDLLEKRLPLEVTRAYTGIEEALALPQFVELAPLYALTQGSVIDQKLESMFLSVEARPEKKIELMTIHKSKGLGADHVFMIGLTEGIIPNKKRGSDTIESQRRLFYVGMTRAKKNLYLISSVKIRGKDVHTVNKEDFKYNWKTQTYDGRASRFVEELGL